VREAFQHVPSPRSITPQTAALDPRSDENSLLDAEPLTVGK
jgi:hypothetical protein